MSDTESFIEKFQNLNITQKRLVTDLIEEITSNNQQENTPIQPNQLRVINPKFVSFNGIQLAIGDKVRILNNRKSGKHGDIGTVNKFNKIYVAIKLSKNRSITQRASKHLEHID